MTESRPWILPPYSPLDEPELRFASTVPTAVDAHPLRGLAKFGPYSSSFPQYTPRVRVAIAGPVARHPEVVALLSSLRSTHRPQDRPEYVPRYDGFATVMRADLEIADTSLHIGWPAAADELPGRGQPHIKLGFALDEALRVAAARRSEFDVLVVHLPDSWTAATRMPAFDAHDFLKVRAALVGIPTQVLNDRSFEFEFRTSLAWRLAIALYAKAGGVPWKLAPIKVVPPGTAYIGLAYALRGDPRESKFITCCSQVFDEDGGGMQFVAYEATDPVEDEAEARHNPYLSRRDMRAVITRSLLLYQARNGGGRPRRLVIHKRTPFQADELAGLEDAAPDIDELECLEINADVAWRGVWLQAPERSSQAPSRPDPYPVPRGVMVPISGSSALLWAAGNVPEVSTKGGFYQGGKSIPRPLRIIRHAGHGALEVPATEALALTKMDWNNDALYDPVPVTILYAQRLARIIAHVGAVPTTEYPYRLFM